MMIRKILVIAVLVAVIAITLISIALHARRNACGHLPPDELRLFFDAYKAVGVAFLVTLLAAIIPQLLPEARDRFERFKDSRIAYSQAKTSVIYLPEKLSSLAFGEAVTAVQEAHERLHLAETYPRELREHLHWHRYPDTWVDRNYWELFAMRKVLDLHVDSWPKLTAGERLKALRMAIAVVDEIFGTDNERWSGLQRAVREREVEDALDCKVVPRLVQGGHSDESVA